CASAGEPGRTYNVASGRETSILELAERINRLAGNLAPIEMTGKRDWDRSGKRYGATETARSALGFEARVGLEEGLARTIAWCRDHLGLIESCIDRHRQRLAA